MIYLDNAATTRIDEEVLEEMTPFLTENYGNPSAMYPFGTETRRALDVARERVASLISAEPSQIIFTSGGSESNNLVIHNIPNILKLNGKIDVITTEGEHDSVIRPVERECKRLGFGITLLQLNKNGYIDTASFERSIDNNTGFCSVMAVNNETGSENPIKELGMICRANNIIFHTDCVQAAGYVDINVNDMYCDFLSMSSHKIHGPKGVGALYVRDKAILDALILGGHDQEFGIRGGTENVAGIVGFGKACEIAKSMIDVDTIHVSELKQLFYSKLCSLLGENPKINGYNITHPGKILNIMIKGVHAETLVLMMGAMGVCISAGSACRSRETKPSRTLVSMGLTDKESTQCVRVSFSRMNTREEVIKAAEIMSNCISILRGNI